ncbi:MAG TPA: adenylate/guanylate cyclase domain-containing protein [Thermoleophilaceae bacterium]|nr:adenylate/guanylate cyclase domain-containing protein [Thermoleophilaceae bacterium]
MPFVFDRLYRRLGRLYFGVYTVFEIVSALIICLGTVGLFKLYENPGTTEFLVTLAFAEAVTLATVLWVIFRGFRESRPLFRWVGGRRDPESSLAAWRNGVTFPREFVAASGWKPFALVSIPIAVFVTIYQDLPPYSGLIIFAGALVAVAYAALLHFFASELFLRPVLAHIHGYLPDDFDATARGVPLKWKILGALPIINVITGVVVSGLSTTEQASLEDLGVDVIVAVIVAFTISFELTALVTKSVLDPVGDLLGATERVTSGDFTTRVPVVSGDEMGRLAASFNEMVRGLAEREALREAFGSYVDPDVAERVLAEGELLEGEQVEATMVFVDICDFTAFAENASAREAVAQLNEFFGLVVPLVVRGRGHANKFVGDGVLAVFGAPDRHSDHADCALDVAVKIADAVAQQFGGALRIGIGINSGPVMVGTVGGGGRLEFTVIGDPVNVAARVEEATRETGDAILLTESTRALLGDDWRARLEERGSMPLKGKSEPISLYAVRAEGLPPGAGDAAAAATA